MPLLFLVIALLQPNARANARAQTQAPAGSLVVLGEFSNMKFTEEHAYGYTLQLWRQGDQIIGLLQSSEGLAGDTPTRVLEEVQFDPRTQSLSFKAKLTMGVVLLAQGRQEPTHDLFEFHGTLGRAALAGAIGRRDMLRPATKAEIRQVSLRKQSGENMIEFHSYAEWKKSADQILKFRGPKW